MHYGIRDQKWGVRRFQYEDGSYTPEGKERYSKTKGSKASQSSEEKHAEASKNLADKRAREKYANEQQKLRDLWKNTYGWKMQDDDDAYAAEQKMLRLGLMNTDPYHSALIYYNGQYLHGTAADIFKTLTELAKKGDDLKNVEVVSIYKKEKDATPDEDLLNDKAKRKGSIK